VSVLPLVLLGGVLGGVGHCKYCHCSYLLPLCHLDALGMILIVLVVVVVVVVVVKLPRRHVGSSFSFLHREPLS